MAKQDDKQFGLDTAKYRDGNKEKILKYVETASEDDYISDLSFQENIDNKINKFLKNIKDINQKQTELFNLRQKFVDDYKPASLINLTLDKYVIGLQSHDTFCYRLENELNELGNIHGATASKFGVYFGEKGDDTEPKYRYTKKFGNDVNSAFITIKQELCSLIAAGISDDYDSIRNSKFAPLVRGKVLFVYYPDKFLNIFSDEHLNYFLDVLKIAYDKKDDPLDKQLLLIRWKNKQRNLDNIDLYKFSTFLYQEFGQPLKEAEQLDEEERQYDKQYPKEYIYQLAVDKDEWKKLLKDKSIFYEKNIDMLKKIYLSQHHASTCSSLAEIEGVHPSTYIKPVVALSRRILKEMDLPELKRKNSNKNCYWPVLFWGRYVENGRFEWKLRPDLVKAIKELYPEWDSQKSNTIADDKLIEDLKFSSLEGVQESFEYSGKPKDKSDSVIIEGHRTYPRDRKVAINALSKANFLCECNEEHLSFISKKSNRRYMEPHHLIPLAFSDSFKYSLDIEENIVSLCSNCHNEIHYGKDASEMIKKLFKKRKAVLEKAGIHITEDKLLEMYK